MSRILITAGPTREYLDPIRYLSNASSGKMGAALANAALHADCDVTIVTGPVTCDYPQEAEVIRVTTTDEMLQACIKIFPGCNGAIGAAAPCDFRPKAFSVDKIKKSGDSPMALELVRTPDIFAELGKIKRSDQWLVPFALETIENGNRYALEKLRQKNGDFVILNGPQAMMGDQADVEILDSNGTTLAAFRGEKINVAAQIIQLTLTLFGS